MGRRALPSGLAVAVASLWMGVAAVGVAQPTFRAASLSVLPGTTSDATGLGVLADVGSPNGQPDGRLDAVVLSQAQSLTVLFGSEGGRLVSGPSTDLVGVIPSAVVGGDWNRDGLIDLAIADSSNLLSLWRGIGDGTFASFGSSLDLAFSARSLVAVDLNRDRLLDLIAVGDTLQQAGVGRVLYGNGDGSFTPTPELFDAGFGSASAAAGDLDGDGRVDLAVANEGTDEVYILRGDGAGGFTLLRRVGVGQAPNAVALADLDGNGRLDILLTNGNSDSVSVIRNVGGGNFAAAQEFPVGAVAATPRGLALGDVDADGRLDALVANNFSFDVAVLRGDGQGGFLAARAFVADAEPLGVLAGDLDGDGRVDAVGLTRGGGTSPSAAVLRSLGGGRLSGVENVPLSGAPVQVAVADLEGDGLSDALVAQVGAGAQVGRARVFSSFGTGGFGAARELLSAGDAIAVVAGDFDGDLRADFALINRSPAVVSVFRQNQSGSFENKAPIGHSAGSVNAAVAWDFDGDGRTDLALVGQQVSGEGVVQVLSGGPGGVFVPRTSFQVGDLPLGVDVGDFNQDGIADLVTANNASSNVSIALGNGDGTFGTPTSLGVSGGPRSIAVADFDRDGLDDIAVSTVQPAGVNVFFGDGTGRFPNSITRPLSVGAGEVPAAVAARDMDGDGAPDVLVAGETNNSIRLFLRSGGNPRAFQSADVTGVNRRPVSLVTADFDGDGRYDAAAATTSPAPTMSVLTNIRAAGLFRGDGNGDGRVTASDCVALARKISERLVLRVEDVAARGSVRISAGADADGNGLITALDIASLPGRLFR